MCHQGRPKLNIVSCFISVFILLYLFYLRLFVIRLWRVHSARCRHRHLVALVVAIVAIVVVEVVVAIIIINLYEWRLVGMYEGYNSCH